MCFNECVLNAPFSNFFVIFRQTKKYVNVFNENRYYLQEVAFKILYYNYY